jgi:hypothetical protein
MKKMLISAAAMTLLTGGVAIPFAAPASAGCQSVFIGIFGGGQRCDGPVDPVGYYTRCDSGQGMGFGGSNCYAVNVGDLAQPPRIP